MDLDIKIVIFNSFSVKPARSTVPGKQRIMIIYKANHISAKRKKKRSHRHIIEDVLALDVKFVRSHVQGCILLI
jgi:hypothetical protein